jgi:hypothetical protein
MEDNLKKNKKGRGPQTLIEKMEDKLKKREDDLKKMEDDLKNKIKYDLKHNLNKSTLIGCGIIVNYPS